MGELGDSLACCIHDIDVLMTISITDKRNLAPVWRPSRVEVRSKRVGCQVHGLAAIRQSHPCVQIPLSLTDVGDKPVPYRTRCWADLSKSPGFNTPAKRVDQGERPADGRGDDGECEPSHFQPPQNPAMDPLLQDAVEGSRGVGGWRSPFEALFQVVVKARQRRSPPPGLLRPAPRPTFAW